MIRKTAGFTLMEFLLAAAIISVIGMSVASLATVFGTAYDNSQGFYTSLQAGRASMFRMASTMRKAKLITASTGTSFAVWVEDANSNLDGKINLSEIRVYSYDANAQQISEQRVMMDGLTPSQRASLDTQLTLSQITSVSSALTLIKASTYYVSYTMADQVTSFAVSVSPAAPLASTVSVDMKLGAAANPYEIRSAFSMRASAVSRVSLSQGIYVLN